VVVLCYTGFTMIISNDFKQSGSTWLQWRNKGLGASDAPAILGVSPWTSRFEVWTYKCDIATPPPMNPFAQAAVERGKFLEPIARAWYEKKTGRKMEVINVEHPVHKFIRASLDGADQTDMHLLEIKAPGKVDHATAISGKVPDKYLPQLMHQFLASEAKTLDYVSFDGTDGVIVPVARDEAYITNLLSELITFWDLVQTKTPPKVTKDDLKKAIQLVEGQTQSLAKSVATLGVLREIISPKYSKKGGAL